MPTLAEILAEPNPAAEQLIRDYLPLAERSARFWERKFPHDDPGPTVMSALYIAAYTYRPGRGTFGAWFAWKISGQMATLYRKQKRYRQGLRLTRVPRGDESQTGPPIRFSSFNSEAIDQRLSYRDGD